MSDYMYYCQTDFPKELSDYLHEQGKGTGNALDAIEMQTDDFEFWEGWQRDLSFAADALGIEIQVYRNDDPNKLEMDDLIYHVNEYGEVKACSS